MKNPAALGLAAALALFALAGTSSAQPPAAAPVPDFSGFWQIDFSLMLGSGNGPADLPEGWRVFGGFRTNPQPPLRPEAYAQVRDRRIKEADATHTGDGTDPQTANCMPGSFPDMLSFFDPLDIFQRADELMMVTERERQLPRHIYILPFHKPVERYDHTKNGVVSYNGRSLAHWEGRTLVIRTEALDPGPWMFTFDRIPKSDAMTTDERLSISDDGKVLTDILTITDPKTLTQPWTLTIKWNRAAPGTEHIESVCVREEEAYGDLKK